MSNSSAFDSNFAETQAQITELRAKLDALMTNRIEPALHSAVDQAKTAASAAQKYVADDVEIAAETIRKRPFAAIAVAAAAGFLIARLTR